MDELLSYCEARLFNHNIEYPITKTFSYDFIHDVKRETTIEFTPTLKGATSTTAQMLLEGSDKVSDNFKAKATLTCTLNDPKIIL